MDATLRLGGSFRVTNKPLHLPSIVPETPMEENAMAKDRKPAEDLSAFANQGMAQARNAVDTYFDFLKTAVSSTPSGGTEFGERLKSYAESNLATTYEFVRQLSQAKDLNEMVRIQTEFMQSLVKAMSEQTKELTEAYTKTASDIVKKPFPSISS